MATGPVDLDMGAGYRPSRPPITNSPMPCRHPLTPERLHSGMALSMPSWISHAQVNATTNKQL